MSASANIGTELAGYRLEALIGRGGMGVVYRAHDLALDRDVALKLLAPHLADDVSFRERFLRESRLAASLEHPNVVPIHDAGEIDGQLYIAMRLVEGSDLKAVLREGPLEPARAVRMLQQVAGALDAAHARGLVHRDVKPSNVLIDEREHVYLADFGLSRRLGDAATPLGAAKSLGTADYVAPEQIRGEEVDGRADVYALGCMLYECLAGDPPFRRGSDAATLFAHLEEQPPTLPRLEQVLPKALAKGPDERYQTGGELVLAAREALGIVAPKRARWPAAVAALGLLLIGGALLAFFLTRGGAPPAEAATGRLFRIDPGVNKVVDTVNLGQNVSGVTVGGGQIWLTTFRDSSLWRIDPKTLEALRIPAGGRPIGVAVRAGVAYVAVGGGGTVGTSVTRFDVLSGARIDAIEAAGGVGGVTAIAAGPSGVWVGTCCRVAHLSAGSAPGRTVSSTAIPYPSRPDESHVRFNLEALAVGPRAVWVLGDALDRRLWQVETPSAHVGETVELPFIARRVAVGRGGVWVTAQLDDTVSRIDPLTGRIVATIKVGRGASSIAVGGGAVWVANTIDRTVSRIDPGRGVVTATIPTRASPHELAFGERSLWVAADAS